MREKSIYFVGLLYARQPLEGKDKKIQFNSYLQAFIIII